MSDALQRRLLRHYGHRLPGRILQHPHPAPVQVRACAVTVDLPSTAQGARHRVRIDEAPFGEADEAIRDGNDQREAVDMGHGPSLEPVALRPAYGAAHEEGRAVDRCEAFDGSEGADPPQDGVDGLREIQPAIGVGPFRVVRAATLWRRRFPVFAEVIGDVTAQPLGGRAGSSDRGCHDLRTPPAETGRS